MAVAVYSPCAAEYRTHQACFGTLLHQAFTSSLLIACNACGPLLGRTCAASSVPGQPEVGQCMFGLIAGCLEAFLKKEQLRILVIGLDKSGKTTLLEHLKTRFSPTPGLEADKILPTVGLNVARLDAFGVQLLLWDLGGQAGLRSIWDKYFADSHGLIFVVDAAAAGRQGSETSLAPCTPATAT